MILSALAALAIALASLARAADFYGLGRLDVDADRVQPGTLGGQPAPKIVSFNVDTLNRMRIRIDYFADYNADVNSFEEYLGLIRLYLTPAGCGSHVRIPLHFIVVDVEEVQVREVADRNELPAGEAPVQIERPPEPLEMFFLLFGGKVRPTPRGRMAAHRVTFVVDAEVYAQQLHSIGVVSTCTLLCLKYAQVVATFESASSYEKFEFNTTDRTVLRLIRRRNVPVQIPDMTALAPPDADKPAHDRARCSFCNEPLRPTDAEAANAQQEGILDTPRDVSILQRCAHAYHTNCLERIMVDYPTTKTNKCLQCRTEIRDDRRDGLDVFSDHVNRQALGIHSQITWNDIAKSCERDF